MKNLWPADRLSFMEKLNPARDLVRVLVIVEPFTGFSSSVACREWIAIEIPLNYLREIKFGIHSYFVAHNYRGAGKSLARPGRNQATATKLLLW
jgi:hypothetical protein